MCVLLGFSFFFLSKLIKFISILETAIGENTLLTEAEMSTLRPIFGDEKHFYEAFLDVLKLNSWFSDAKLKKEFEKPLMRLCAQYLYLVKRRGYALDPVGKILYCILIYIILHYRYIRRFEYSL